MVIVRRKLCMCGILEVQYNIDFLLGLELKMANDVACQGFSHQNSFPKEDYTKAEALSMKMSNCQRYYVRTQTKVFSLALQDIITIKSFIKPLKRIGLGGRRRGDSTWQGVEWP